VPKTWIITGSSRGLARTLAEAALAAGEKVAATARRVDGLKDLKDRYRDQVLLLPLDVTNETQAIEAVTSTIRTFGRGRACQQCWIRKCRTGRRYNA
jgi:NADP-dependent 3-hydroxy acid dehydrogenase YdfG